MVKGTEKNLRDYLNAKESEEWIFASYMMDYSSKIKNNWTNITAEEKKYLKYVNTYIAKWAESVMHRLKREQVDKLRKWIGKYDLVLAGREDKRKIAKVAEEELKNVTMSREQFEDWCSEIMDVKCKGCSKDWFECEFHKLMIDNNVPEATPTLKNCRYAYERVES